MVHEAPRYRPQCPGLKKGHFQEEISHSWKLKGFLLFYYY